MHVLNQLAVPIVIVRVERLTDEETLLLSRTPGHSQFVPVFEVLLQHVVHVGMELTSA